MNFKPLKSVFSARLENSYNNLPVHKALLNSKKNAQAKKPIQTY